MNRPSIGILAYGSLLADPGEEITEMTVDRIPVTTPFPIEYARSSRGRAGAPTLVPVEFSEPVNAQILVIHADFSEQEVKNRLYRREIGPKAKLDAIYDEASQRTKNNAVLIKTVQDLADVSVVYYTFLKANIPEISRSNLSVEAKAAHLARLAVESVTAETYAADRDGIRYLADALAHGIRTPLTAAYRAAILRLADDAPDLATARQRIAQKKEIVLEDGA
jgi:hypothetical protein